MNIDLYYDPVRPETTVRIDGRWTDASDIYGFLYPVRRHLLQTWLRPSGSWMGLAKQLTELARGESVALTFHGRAIDYQDLASALEGVPQLTLNCEESTQMPAGSPLSPGEQLMAIFREPVVMERDGDEVISRTGEMLFPDFVHAFPDRLPPKPHWLCTIRSDSDFHQAQRSGECCLVEGDWLDSYEKLPALEGLTRSMRRCADMIVCRMRDAQIAGDFERYNSQCSGIEARFVCVGDDSWREALWIKYGEPMILRGAAQDAKAAAQAVGELLAMKPEIDAKVRAMRRQETPESERALWEYRQLWLNKRQPALHALENSVLLPARPGKSGD